MKIVITGGGTAGHVNPALAVAQELRTLGHEVVYAGTPQGLEARLAPQEGFPYTSFRASGFNRRKPLSLIVSTARVAASAFRARRWLKTLKPAAVVGFGGYVSIPVGLAASWLKIPLAVHEQNSTSGMANRFLAKRAQLVALTYESAAGDFQTGGEVRLSGNPIRPALLNISRASARATFGLPADATVLLAFGGSLGAQHINESLISHAEALLADPKLHILHITGAAGHADVTARLAAIPQAAERWHLIAYCDQMGEAYAAADAVLSRAGATTLAELAALGMPALLVPYPYAAADEQTTNARQLAETGAALLIADAELDEPVFLESLMRLVSSEEGREQMRQAASALGGSRAREELARLIIAMAEGQPLR
jgi:UDP-N-acetylglucosamine--N-acetylmuramyl-(pentapeptide) pyrophosphoryl-undecaprenol N-acetylglucosamine transferase